MTQSQSCLWSKPKSICSSALTSPNISAGSPRCLEGFRTMWTTSSCGSRVESGKAQSALDGCRSRMSRTPNSFILRIRITRTNLHVRGEIAKKCTPGSEKRCFKYSQTLSPPLECTMISSFMMFKRRWNSPRAFKGFKRKVLNKRFSALPLSWKSLNTFKIIWVMPVSTRSLSLSFKTLTQTSFWIDLSKVRSRISWLRLRA